MFRWHPLSRNGLWLVGLYRDGELVRVQGVDTKHGFLPERWGKQKFAMWRCEELNNLIRRAEAKEFLSETR